ncbi:hypothetical protein N7472_009683 [Penicillium cf. griseofulvum]|uniref:Uncharacterized protein n=1 Tax=Penicillium cf. griseofulvum TaxID=2972120 RepID=A0A9W9ITJ3_9EURO|nr:hypothetical protein N7472_009683 [Penicillium cf. griseofulvum]
MFDFLKLVLGGFDRCGLMAYNVFQGADEFPHVLGGDSTRRVRRYKDISTPSSLPVFVQQAGRVDGSKLPHEAGGGCLGGCGKGLGPSRRWVRDRRLVPARYTTS